MAGNGFYNPPVAFFGYGARVELIQLIKDRGYHKILLVTDEGLCKAGITKKVTDIMAAQEMSYVIFDQVQPNPTMGNVGQGLGIYREQQCDCILALGGGSPQDCAKAIGLMAFENGNLLDYLQEKVEARGSVDVFAITTTAGTGSECTRSYVITDEKSSTKYGIRDNWTQVKAAVNDWELMMGLPKALTAQTGMDALTHAVESLIGNSSFLVTERLALSAIELIFEFLPLAVAEPENEKAREAMCTAQYFAGLAFGNSGVGLVHSMSHQLSALYHMPHGMANALLLPFVLEYDLDISKQQLAKITKVVKPLLIEGKDDLQLATMAIDLITELSKKVETYLSLRQCGVEQEMFDLMAQKTLVDSSIGNSPKMPSAAEVKAIFEKAAW